MKIKWDSSQRSFLSENYQKMTFAEIGTALGGRSRRAVQIEALRMGLPSKLSLMPESKKCSRYNSYDSYSAMMDRCNNETHPSFPEYGGRGISVCKRWAESFWNFLSDMGERPAGMSIDRINPDGNYEQENCRWIPKNEQASTTRRHYRAIKPCEICEKRPATAGKGRCYLCYDYLRRTGNERPKCEAWSIPRKIRPDIKCSNCGIIARPVKHGRCSSCATYFYRTQTERPQKFW